MAWSIHAEGRALDLGIRGSDELAGNQVLEQLLAARGEALQRIIWWHRIYDLVSPLGRPYDGLNPHTDHLHIELGWPAARREIPLGLDDWLTEDEDPMPNLLVAFHGAQWCVRPDLTGRVGLSDSTDVRALLALNGGRSYQPAELSDALMARIPEVSAL